MEFNSDIPHSKAKFVLVKNFSDEVWNFTVINYQIYEPSIFIGVWKIKKPVNENNSDSAENLK